MNRREAIARGMSALAALGAPRLGITAEAAPIPALHPSAAMPPKRYLKAVVDEASLRRQLAPPGAWRPYPKAQDRAGWAGVPADVVEAVVTRADRVLDTEWPQLPASLFLEFKENGNRTHYEQRYFERRSRLTALVLAECLQGQGRYLHAIADGAWLVCEETFWGLPAHTGAQKRGVGLPDPLDPIIDLFAAETGVTMAYVHYLVGDGLARVSPLLPARIAGEVKRRILDPGWQRDDFGWMGAGRRKAPLNNWTSWICSSWLEANLLLEPDPERRIQATRKICACLDRFLEDYSVDGACEEGPGYWAVSAGSYADCLAALGSALGSSSGIDLARDPFVRRMGHYLVDVHIAGDWYVNYGDAHAKLHHSPALMFRFGRATGDADLMAFGAFHAPDKGFTPSSQGRLARDVADVLATGAMRAQPRADALVGRADYPALGLFTARATEGGSRGFYLAVQTASNARSHGHHDSGSFIVFHDGLPVFVDPGVEAYTARTFSAERYTIWTMQSGYHNLPMVGGRMQAGGDVRYRARAGLREDGPSHVGVAMDLAPAFAPDAGVQHWQRHIRLARDADAMLLSETFALARAQDVALVFMTPRVPAPGEAGTLILPDPAGTGAPVTLRFDPKVLRADVERLALADPGLKYEWGEALYRIRLASIAPLAQAGLEVRIEGRPATLLRQKNV